MAEEKEMTLEEAFTNLEEVIEKMEDKEIPLEESFELYKKGIGLLKDVNDKIDLVEKQVMVMHQDGSLTEMPPMEN